VKALGQVKEELKKCKVKVVVISFVKGRRAEHWLEEIVGFGENHDFTMLFDETREVYHAYGLKRDAKASWGAKAIKYYAREFIKGHFTGIYGDPNQLGGDFLVSCAGILQLCHPSKDPTDRPDPAEVIRVAARHEKLDVPSNIISQRHTLA